MPIVLPMSSWQHIFREGLCGRLRWDLRHSLLSNLAGPKHRMSKSDTMAAMVDDDLIRIMAQALADAREK